MIKLFGHTFSPVQLLMLVAGTVGALFALSSQGPAVWSAFGWVTPAAHAAAIESVVMDRASLEESLAGELKSFRDEWKCDEYDEELEELLEDEQAGDTSVDTAERIRRIRELRRERGCARFDE